MRATLIVFILLAGLTSLAQNYTFVFLNNKPDKKEISKEESDKIQQGHMANINRLAQEDKLIAAGPFEGGGGIFIFNTTSVDEAKEWLSTDPGVKANRWNLEILPYHPRTGGVCKVGEPYEMVMYTFVRFSAQVTKTTSVNYPDILRRHDEYIKAQFSKTADVVTEGIFGEYDGGILVLKGDLIKEIIEVDPGVQEALLQFEIKKLYIAKGSFCEK